MTSRRRLVLLALAAVVAVGGIALASSSGSDDEPAQDAARAPAETQPAAGDGAATAPRTQDEAAPAPRVESLRIRGGAPVGEPRTLRYERGETIRLRFASDEAEEVHVHGFDEYVDVPAGGSARARFDASLEGIFEVEAHGSGELLAKLEIRPK